ncbi:MAG: hypothetical protein B0W54_14245 [Cellvibrio sp. 79]|nr:MAG: hypothetical protein B0W54_14245 [Cellvibrio sp. 79]
MFQRSLLKLLLPFCFLIPVEVLAQGSAFNLENWPETPANLKPMYVKAIMEQAGVHKVSFKLPADFYIAELDKFATTAAENNYRPYLKTSVAQNLATLAVIHCDWNNGVPPWEFAQKYLGNQQMELLKTLYPVAINKLQNNCTE